MNDFKNINEIDITSFVPIKNYKNYMINRDGEVIRLIGDKFRYIAISINKYNNAYFRAYKNNTPKTFYLANILAEIFIPNPKKAKRVYHKNKNTLDNRIDNLLWATPDILSKKRIILKSKKELKGFIELKNFPGYFINKKGIILRFNKDKKTYKKRTHSIRNGYYSVLLAKNGKKVNSLVHRLLAETFIGNPKKYKHVTHIDKDRLNNSLKNLKWIDKKYSDDKKAKTIFIYDIYKNLVGEYESIRECHKHIKISKYKISRYSKSHDIIPIPELEGFFILHRQKITSNKNILQFK